MKIISEKTVKGKRRITVEIEEGEELKAFDPNKFYTLGQPLEDDVLTGDVLLNSAASYWCIVEQKWKEE